MPILLNEPRRKHQRYSHPPDERSYLARHGLQAVDSSNVSAVGVRGDNLIIRFLNGSLYAYFGQSEKFDSILNSNSKGHWVWVNLRRKPVRYEKIGALPLPSDEQLAEEDLFALIDQEGQQFENVLRALGIAVMPDLTNNLELLTLNQLLGI